MDEKARKVPDLTLEKLVLGELSEKEKAEVLDGLKSEENGMARLEEIRKSNEDILQKYPPAKMAQDIKGKLAADSRIAGAAEPFWKRWGLAYAVPFVLTAILAIVILPNWPIGANHHAHRPDDEKILLKGHPHLIIYKKTGDMARMVADGGFAGRGDVLQISYVPMDKTRGVIISLDGRGNVTFHLPENPDRGAAILESEKTYLPHSYELDDAPDFERFFFITSDVDMDLTQIRAAAERLAAGADRGRDGDLGLPKEYEQSSVLLNKGRENEK